MFYAISDIESHDGNLNGCYLQLFFINAYAIPMTRSGGLGLTYARPLYASGVD